MKVTYMNRRAIAKLSARAAELETDAKNTLASALSMLDREVKPGEDEDARSKAAHDAHLFADSIGMQQSVRYWILASIANIGRELNLRGVKPAIAEAERERRETAEMLDELRLRTEKKPTPADLAEIVNSAVQIAGTAEVLALIAKNITKRKDIAKWALEVFESGFVEKANGMEKTMPPRPVDELIRGLNKIPSGSVENGSG